MSVKRYFERQFKLRRFLLEHDVTSDFYLSCFQTSRSAVPLFITRLVIYIGCLGTLISSLVVMPQLMPIQFWPIYMTHWGLILNTITAGLGLSISVLAYIKLLTDLNPKLTWYVQAYWATVNLSTPIAFFITIFYWVFLTDIDEEFAMDPTLDIFAHLVNSILMLALFITSRHPMNFFHFYFSLSFGIIYLIFSYVYYALGGTDGFGNHSIYPMLDWERPGLTMIIAVLSAVSIALMQVVTVGLAACRDTIISRVRNGNMAYNVYAT